MVDLQTGYATTEADQWRDREFRPTALDAADLAEAFVTTQANNYAAHMTTMAATHASPWAERERDVAIEEASRVAAEAFAEKTKRQSQAGAERTREVAAATAAGDLTKAEALAARDKAIAQAATDFDTAEDAAQALVDLAIAGWHRPAGSYSTGLELSGIGHPSSESEWWRYEVDDYYDALIGFMFETASGYGQWNGAGIHSQDTLKDFVDELQEEIHLPESPDEFLEISTSFDELGQSVQTQYNRATGEYTLTVMPTVSGAQESPSAASGNASNSQDAISTIAAKKSTDYSILFNRNPHTLLPRKAATRTTTTATSAYEQQLLDYYRRVMQLMILTGNVLWKSGAPALERVFGVTNTNFNDATGESLLLQIKRSGKEYAFPGGWEQLRDKMRYSIDNYDTISTWNVTLGDGNYNFPNVPGINLDEQLFKGDTLTGIHLLIHEPLHDWSQYAADFDVVDWESHSAIRNIVPTLYPPHGGEHGEDLFSRYIDFLKNAKSGNKSLWEIILGRAGPRPVKP